MTDALLLMTCALWWALSVPLALLVARRLGRGTTGTMGD